MPVKHTKGLGLEERLAFLEDYHTNTRLSLRLLAAISRNFVASSDDWKSAKSREFLVELDRVIAEGHLAP